MKESKHQSKNKVLTLTFVMKWQIAHLTDGAPAGYISMVWQFPQLTWAILLCAGGGAADAAAAGAANPSFSNNQIKH